MNYMNPEQKVSAAAAALLNDLPFYGILLYRMKLVPATNARGVAIPTMGTDGKHIWYNPLFVEELVLAEVKGVLLHEVLHVANGHHLRRNGRDHRIWNKACDYAINPIVAQNRMMLPAGALINPAFSDWSAEEVFEQLTFAPPQQQALSSQGKNQASPQKGSAESEEKDDEPEDEDAGDDQPANDNDAERVDEPTDPLRADRSGDEADERDDADDSGDDSDDESDGEEQSGPEESPAQSEAPETHERHGLIFEPIDDEGEPLSDAEIEQEMDRLQVAIIQAASAAKSAGALPAGAERLVEDAKHPRDDWRDVLRRFVTQSVETPADHTWARPNRRFVSSGTYLPGWRKEDTNNLLIVIDSSGSTFSTPALPRFYAEMQRILEDTQPQEIGLIICDNRVQFSKVYQQGETVPQICPGGGGTGFSPVWEHLATMDFKPAGCVFFTDCECWDWGKDPGIPVLWAKWGHAGNRPPFGEVLDINQPNNH